MATQETAEGQNQAATASAAPVPSLDAKKAEVLARVRASDTDRAARNDDAPATPAPAAAAPLPAPAAPPPAGADQSIAELKTILAALEAKISPPAAAATAPAVDKYTELQERIKADPYAIFDEFPELLTLEKISEEHLKRTENPAHKELTAHEREIADLKKRLDDKEKGDKDRETAAQVQAAEKAGRDTVKTLIDGEKGRWPRIVRAEENTSEAIGLAIDASRKAVAELRKTKGEKWSPTDDEAKAIVNDCLDRVEKDFEARAARYAAPDIAPARSQVAPATATRTIPPTAKLSGAARSGDPPPDTKDLAQRKADIVRAVRRNARQSQE